MGRWAGCSGVWRRQHGALRAAELAGTGITGVGVVYNLLISGVLHSDDEVAVAHGRPDQDFVPFSDALVSIRWNLNRAVTTGVLSCEGRGRE